MKLPKIRDRRIAEIEDAGMDDERFFVHLKPGFDWNVDVEPRRTQSFGSRAEVIEALRSVKKVQG